MDFVNLPLTVHRELAEAMPAADLYRLRLAFPNLPSLKHPKQEVVELPMDKNVFCHVYSAKLVLYSEGLNTSLDVTTAEKYKVFVIPCTLYIVQSISENFELFDHLYLNIKSVGFAFSIITLTTLKELKQRNARHLEYFMVNTSNISGDVTIKDFLDVSPVLKTLILDAMIYLDKNWLWTFYNMFNMEAVYIRSNANPCLDFGVTDLIMFLMRQSQNFKLHLTLLFVENVAETKQLLCDKLQNDFVEVDNFDGINHPKVEFQLLSVSERCMALFYYDTGIDSQEYHDGLQYVKQQTMIKTIENEMD